MIEGLFDALMQSAVRRLSSNGMFCFICDYLIF